MRKTILTLLVSLVLGFSSLYASASPDREESDFLARAGLSPEEQAQQDARVQALLSQSRLTRNAVAVRLDKAKDILSALSEEGMRGPMAYAEHAELLGAATTFYDKIQEIPDTKRLQDGLGILAANLQKMPLPVLERLRDRGCTEAEWPEEERSLVAKIQFAVVEGNYGASKGTIIEFEESLKGLQSKRGETKYVSFQFNDTLEQEDQSLLPVLKKSQDLVNGLFNQASTMKEQLPAFEKKLGEAGRIIIEKMIDAFQHQAFWEQGRLIFLEGLHYAQTQGWGNLSRQCLVAALLDCAASGKMAASALQSLMSELQEGQAAAAQQ
tara:strand:- start:2482 stop:3456 length:975 start_codon:yes stop_codon:yes gene_type:complete